MDDDLSKNPFVKYFLAHPFEWEGFIARVKRVAVDLGEIAAFMDQMKMVAPEFDSKPFHDLEELFLRLMPAIELPKKVR